MTSRSVTNGLNSILIIAMTILINKIDAICYFPAEFQGTYLIQTQASPAYGGHTVTYSEVSVEADAIPPWGRCHRRSGHNVILKDSSGGEDCMRCFHLTLKTPNVIQIHSEGLARCYTNEEAARATCPDDRAVLERKFNEIMMYRKQQNPPTISPAGFQAATSPPGIASGIPGMTIPGQPSSVSSVFCPINGRYRFSYTANNGLFRCNQANSELADCPYGNGMAVKFRECNFPDLDVSFVCLGEWKGEKEDRYLALMDLRDDPESRPRYRCGLYRLEPHSGRVYVSLSADSTCFNQLNSATDGYESLLLSPVPDKELPEAVEKSECRFPEWSSGKWDSLEVAGNRFVFRDINTFQTLHGRCIGKGNETPSDKYSVYYVTQCGEERYNCMRLIRRSSNVLEFQLGSEPKTEYIDTICNDPKFETNVTQGREGNSVTSCPITGDYWGEIPGAPGLCAKVASDCNNPDVMFYTVSTCENRSHVFEEREYRCLGNWEEDGIVYTYTQRRDMQGFQCFSGKVNKNGQEAYIKEAGESCIRGESPEIYGMKIMKQTSCQNIPAVTFVPVRPPWRPPPPPPPSVQHIPPGRPILPTSHDPYWYQTETEEPTTKPWKPITGRPRPNHTPTEAPASSSSPLSAFVSMIFLTFVSHFTLIR